MPTTLKICSFSIEDTRKNFLVHDAQTKKEGETKPIVTEMFEAVKKLLKSEQEKEKKLTEEQRTENKKYDNYRIVKVQTNYFFNKTLNRKVVVVHGGDKYCISDKNIKPLGQTTQILDILSKIKKRHSCSGDVLFGNCLSVYVRSIINIQNFGNSKENDEITPTNLPDDMNRGVMTYYAEAEKEAINKLISRLNEEEKEVPEVLHVLLKYHEKREEREKLNVKAYGQDFLSKMQTKGFGLCFGVTNTVIIGAVAAKIYMGR